MQLALTWWRTRYGMPQAPAFALQLDAVSHQHLVKLPLYGDCIRQGHSRRDMCCNAMPHTGAARHATLATGLLDAVLCTICTQLSLHTTTLSRLCTADTSTAVFCRGQGYAHVQHALQLSQQQQGNVQQQPPAPQPPAPAGSPVKGKSYKHTCHCLAKVVLALLRHL